MADATILIVEDEEKMRRLFDLVLRPEGYHLLQADSGEAALKLLEEGGVDLVLTDLQMAKVSGLEVLEHVTKDYPELPVVIITGYGTVKSAVEAVKKGAFDYISKPVDNDELKIVVRRALEMRRLTQEHRGLSQELRARFDFDNIVGRSVELAKVKALAKDLAVTDSTVLISGESGTGKEVVARAIHRASPRAGGPFVAINCAAIPESLLESELFGHARGAFTGATTESMGLFEAADGGTLLLDEIGELPLGLQAKLLRVLQDGEIRRVGDQRTRRVDVRLLAATARDLAAEAKAGQFREDLFYRLNVVAIHLPPLRERPEDIAPLARLFAAQLSRRLGRSLELAPAALAWVERQAWPGNVRELQHAIERAAVLTDKQVLDVEDLRRGPAAASRTPGASPGKLRDAADEAEREAIQAALDAAGGNRRDAAKRLGISLRTLFYKIARLKLL